jgi:integrase
MNTIREAVQEYLTMRRGLGFKLRAAGRGLLDFVTFMEQHHASYITHQLALTWAQQPLNVQPVLWAQRLSFVRGFARHRSATDPRTQIPPEGLLPYRARRPQPYIYADDEISGQARNLEVQDVDLNEAVLTIRGSKFGKSRLVPLHCSSRDVLASYIRRREHYWGKRQVSVEPSICYPARSGCVAIPIVMGRGCTTSDIDSL